MVIESETVKGIRGRDWVFPSFPGEEFGCVVRNLYTYFGQPAWPLSEKCLQVSDMSDQAPDLKAAVLQRIQSDVPRKAWTPSDFLDLGSRDAIDKALQRLTTAEQLRRIDRGLYDRPGFNKLTQKSNPPDPRSVIEALGRRDQVRMLVDGMTAANDLGLTDAVPAKIVVHSDARRRALRLGNVTISFRPTAASKLFWAGRPGMRVVQALHWMRDLLSREGEANRVRRKLRKLLDDPAAGPPLKADLIDGLTKVPTWMQVFLKPVLQDDQHVPANPAAADDDHDDDDDHHHHRRRRRSAASRQQDRAANRSRSKAAISSRPLSGPRSTRRTPNA